MTKPKTASKATNKTAPKASKTTNKTVSKVSLSSPSKIKSGDATKVVSKTGFSAAYVSRVKNGTRYNSEIINAFNSLTARRK